MNPGDTRTFKRGDGNAVVLAIGVWAARSGNHIRVDITGAGGSHTTVTNDKNSERYHRTLFRDLRRVLIAEKCWDFGNDGAETEERPATT
jgi:hypothetical protein